MYCKHCGKEIDEGTRFCPHCGLSQDTPTTVNPHVVVTPSVAPQIMEFYNSKQGQIFKIVSILVIGLLMLVSAIVGLVIAPKSTWLVIACVSAIIIGVLCVAHFIYGLIVIRKRNK